MSIHLMKCIFFFFFFFAYAPMSDKEGKSEEFIRSKIRAWKKAVNKSILNICVWETKGE